MNRYLLIDWKSILFIQQSCPFNKKKKKIFIYENNTFVGILNLVSTTYQEFFLAIQNSNLHVSCTFCPFQTHHLLIYSFNYLLFKAATIKKAERILIKCLPFDGKYTILQGIIKKLKPVLHCLTALGVSSECQKYIYSKRKPAKFMLISI